MTLTVIIVTYNVRPHALICLQSVTEALRSIKSEIIVVDNQSTDGTAKSIEEFFPDVRLIVNSQNEGFSKACNKGAAGAHGEYLLFLNPDTILGDRTIPYVLEFMQAHAGTGAAGVRMLNSRGAFLPESKRGRPTAWNAFCKMIGLTAIFPHSRVFAGYQAGHIPERRQQEVEVLSGAFMLIRKSVFEQVGGFDERFFMYGEDIDLSLRIREGGFKNFYLPEAPILHFKGRSSGRSPEQVRRFYKAMFQYIDKYYAHPLQLPGKAVLKTAVFVREQMDWLTAGNSGRSRSRHMVESFVGDPESIESYRMQDSRKEFTSPEGAEAIVFCVGREFGFNELIRYVEEHPGKPIHVYSKSLGLLVD